MALPDREDGAIPDLRIDPAIWNSPCCSQNPELVRLLVSNSLPLPASVYLPSYVLEGLKRKWAPRRTSSPSTSTEDSTLSGLEFSDGLFSIKDISSPISSVASSGDGFRDRAPPMPGHQSDTHGRQGINDQPSCHIQGKSIAFSNFTDGFPQHTAPAMWQPLGKRFNASSHALLHWDTNWLPKTQPSIFYTQKSTQGFSRADPIGRPSLYGTHTRYTSDQPDSNQSTKLSALAPAFSSHVITPPSSPVRLVKIMQSQSWRASPGATMATTTTKTTTASPRMTKNPPSLSSFLSLASTSSCSPFSFSFHGGGAAAASSRHLSPNYRGDPKNPNNQSANVPQEQNTSLFIENLPPDCTTRELLLHLRGTGKVYSLSVGAPTARIPTSCAKLVYWDRRGVDGLTARCDARRFIVRDYCPVVKPNWYRTAPQPAAAGRDNDRSRVVLVEGPSSLVNQPRLEAFFARFFKWDTDEVLIHWENRPRQPRPDCGDGAGAGAIDTITTTSLEYRFASHRAQASEAFRRISQAIAGDLLPGVQLSPEEKLLWKEVRVSWGVDPCA